MASKKKAAAKKKVAAKKSKKVAKVVETVAVEPVPDRAIGVIIEDARKVVEARKAKASAWPAFYPEIAAIEAEIMYVCDPGSEFVRIENGWRVKLVDGGVTILGSGPTIVEAILSHGEQIDHFAVAQAEREKAAAAIAA